MWTLQKRHQTNECKLFLLDQYFHKQSHTKRDLNCRSKPEQSPSTKVDKHSVYLKLLHKQLKLRLRRSFLRQAFLYLVLSCCPQNLSEGPSSRTQSIVFQSKMPKNRQASWKRERSRSELSRKRIEIRIQRTPLHVSPWKLSNDLQCNEGSSRHRLLKERSKSHELWTDHRKESPQRYKRSTMRLVCKGL